MNVGIITVYNSANCGSILQAYSLYSKVMNLGYDPIMIRTGARSLIGGHVRSIFGGMVKCNTKRVENSIQAYESQYDFVKKAFRTATIEEALDMADAYILGSDEIWNLSRSEMSRYPIFWGEGLNPNKTISYAASINNATQTDLRSISSFSKTVSSLFRISVRDAWSMKTVSEVCGKMPEIVLDPTLMYPDAFAWLNQPEICLNQDYLLIYAHPRSLERSKREIKQYASSKALKTVSLSWYNDWCDINVPAKIENFVTYFLNANCIVTNTFHGTAFSILSGQPFAAIAGNNRKVKELLLQFDATEHEWARKDDGHGEGRLLNECLESSDSAGNIKAILRQGRKRSIDYLSSALSSIENM